MLVKWTLTETAKSGEWYLDDLNWGWAIFPMAIIIGTCYCCNGILKNETSNKSWQPALSKVIFLQIQCTFSHSQWQLFPCTFRQSLTTKLTSVLAIIMIIIICNVHGVYGGKYHVIAVMEFSRTKPQTNHGSLPYPRLSCCKYNVLSPILSDNCSHF